MHVHAILDLQYEVPLRDIQYYMKSFFFIESGCFSIRCLLAERDLFHLLSAAIAKGESFDLNNTIKVIAYAIRISNQDSIHIVSYRIGHKSLIANLIGKGTHLRVLLYTVL